MKKNKAPEIYPLGDRGLCISWGNSIAPDLNAQVLQCYARLLAAALPGVLNLVPAYSSLSLIFDTAYLLQTNSELSPFQYLKNLVEKYLDNSAAPALTPYQTHEIPVCYAPEFALDLNTVSTHTSLTPAELVRAHTSRDYQVYLIGFLPGFPYLGTVEARLACPRRAIPRARVPAGSVGIAGQQTGIYPLESPGGWNIIGRTPLRLFDPHRADPVRFSVGDRVRFYAISPKEFQQIITTQ